MDLQHITAAISSLRKKQKIFHSEADFQFSLAWELQKILPAATIRLEYCPPFAREMHIDIYVMDEEGTYPIELKYKSKSVETIVDNEYFKLKNHGAQDLGRYDYLYDVWRIERMRRLDSKFKSGYAIMLTNDPSYWKVSQSVKTIDSAFRIHEGRIIESELAWGGGVSAGTIKGREEALVYEGQYPIHWENYSSLDNTSKGDFKMCLLEVRR